MNAFSVCLSPTSQTNSILVTVAKFYSHGDFARVDYFYIITFEYICFLDLLLSMYSAPRRVIPEIKNNYCMVCQQF